MQNDYKQTNKRVCTIWHETHHPDPDASHMHILIQATIIIDMHQDQGVASHVRAYAYAYERLYIYGPLALEIESIKSINKSKKHPK